ncbi:hypothetical protein HK100_008703 [Physocladia obscura]|uniref:Uncharacterized protein n=1 Tax=Physocladia obscura TaxID=109957 RepID=A0AAD5T9T3_9FUNG|nr:hypothetical protein HK100_008703 [Physocladia obscura]
MGAGASTSTKTISRATTDKFGYCSWCLHKIEEKLKPINVDGAETDPFLVLYRCPRLQCERVLRKCLITECLNYACTDTYKTAKTKESDYSTISRNDNFCLVHLRILGSFEKANWENLPSLESYASIHSTSLGYDCFNVGEALSIAVDTLVRYPPAITLSLAAKYAYDTVATLSSTYCSVTLSLKSLEGVGVDRYQEEIIDPNVRLASRRSAVSAFIMFKNMPLFREYGFILEKNGNADLPIIITVDGFVHNTVDARAWSKLTANTFPENTWLSLQWDAAPAGTWTKQTAIDLALSGTIMNGKIPGTFTNTIASVTTAFSTASENAERVGYLVADAIARLEKSKSVVLMGYSLGASVVYHALLFLAIHELSFDKAAHRDVVKRVERAILLGSACPSKRTENDSMGWNLASFSVKNDITNLYSQNDEVLSALELVTGIARAGRKAIGVFNGFCADKIVNIDCQEICSHFDWHASVASVRLSRRNIKTELKYVSVKNKAMSGADDDQSNATTSTRKRNHPIVDPIAPIFRANTTSGYHLPAPKPTITKTSHALLPSHQQHSSKRLSMDKYGFISSVRKHIGQLSVAELVKLKGEIEESEQAKKIKAGKNYQDQEEQNQHQRQQHQHQHQYQHQHQNKQQQEPVLPNLNGRDGNFIKPSSSKFVFIFPGIK